MTAETVLYLVLGAVAGGFINGFSGTGTALFALGFYLVVLDPITAVAVVALMAVLAGLQGIWVVRHAIMAHPRRPLGFIIPALIGIPIGLALLTVMNTGALRLTTAMVLIVYGGYFSFRTSLPSFTRPTPYIDRGVGFIGGVLGGAAGISGAIPAMWLSMRSWPKAEIRAIMQSFNITVLVTTVFLLFLKGAYDATALSALIVTIPCGLIAAQIGIFVFRRLSDELFRRVLIGLTFLMGVGVFISEVI
ncbi:MAG: sulfite exporter TauE/SafE family protein [Roseobacter sp.]